MAIECELCENNTWCLKYYGEWICKRCFLEECYGTEEQWYELNEEAKERRRDRWY